MRLPLFEKTSRFGQLLQKEKNCMLSLVISADDLTGAKESIFMQAVKYSACKRIASMKNLAEAFNLEITMAENRK
jgi:hypothetical protein